MCLVAWRVAAWLQRIACSADCDEQRAACPAGADVPGCCHAALLLCTAARRPLCRPHSLCLRVVGARGAWSEGAAAAAPPPLATASQAQSQRVPARDSVVVCLCRASRRRTMEPQQGGRRWALCTPSHRGMRTTSGQQTPNPRAPCAGAVRYSRCQPSPAPTW